MTKQNSNPIDRPVARASRGFTLIELLVVITILTVISAILIPRIRVINEDRNIREAARIVASAFAKANARAINDGSAGLMIVPNPNFQGPTFGNTNGPYYAGTRIFQMRQLPPYTGDDDTATATIDATTGTVTIPTPFEHDPSVGRFIVQINDEISFNGSSYRYRINAVNPTGTMLTLDSPTTPGAGVSAPLPVLGAGASFVIHRQPRRLESSVVELPDGYFIDLRYSGPVQTTDPSLGTHFNQDQTVDIPNDDLPASVVLQFDASGAVSRVFFEGMTVHAGARGVAGELQEIRPTGPLNWLVTNFNPASLDPVSGAPATAADDPIRNPSNKWVTVDHVTGGVNVASAVPADGGTVVDQILKSQEIANNRQSAGQ